MAYTLIDDPSAYFQTALWTGGNDASRTITNDGNSDLQPDLIWAKARTSTSYTDNHFIVDSSRGRLKGLVPNDTSAETTTTGNESQQAERDLVSFNSDGFTVGQVNSTAALNASSASLVGWQWKANGGTTASNSNGSITSTVQANTDAGFSIVTYTGTGSDSTVGHGLGVAPSAIIIKSRSNALPWVVWTAGMAGTTSVMELNTTAAEQTVSNYWYNGFSSTTFGLGSGSYSHNTNNYTYVAYCFAEKQGYSKFGSYVGNGNANGPFVYTGFKPAFVMIKKSSSTGQWLLFDNARDPSNKVFHQLRIITAAETTTTHDIDFLSNGFKIRDTVSNDNGSGNTFIYMAFAENPFTTSTGIPTTAR
jgi:hypothetical protein